MCVWGVDSLFDCMETTSYTNLKIAQGVSIKP